MRARYLSLAVGLALVAAACGAGGVDSAGQASSDQVRSTSQVTTSPAPSNSVVTTSSEVTTTSQPAATTTTTTATTTSTSSEAPPAAGTLAAFLAPSGGQQAATSGRFELTLTIVPGPNAEFEEPVAMLITGAYDDAAQSTEMTMDLSGLATLTAAGDEGSEMFAEFFADPMRLISIGDQAWVKWGFFSAFLGAGDKWIEAESEGSEATQSLGLGLGSVGFTPTDFIGALEGADVNVEEVGSEEVRGVQTTKYRAVLDLVAFGDQMTPDELADFEEAIGQGAPAEFPIEMWIDSDGELRRFSLEVASAGLMPDTDPLDSANLLFEMWDIGEDVNIVPPDPADVVSGEDLGFGFGTDS